MRLGCCGWKAGRGAIGICCQSVDCAAARRRTDGTADDRDETQRQKHRRQNGLRLRLFIAHLPGRARLCSEGAGSDGRLLGRSLIRSLLAAWFCAGGRFDNAHGAVGVNEDLVGDAPDIRLGHFVDAVNRAEQLAPVAIARLVASWVASPSLSSRPRIRLALVRVLIIFNSSSLMSSFFRRSISA